MFRSRLIVLGCAAAILAACSDSIGPRPTDVGVLPAGSALLQLSGVLEMIDDSHFGLRQGDNLVPLNCSCELASAVGKEVRLWGTFNSEGVFSVSSYEIPADDEPAYSRVEMGRSRSMIRNGRVLH